MAIYNGIETLEITDQDAWSSIERDMTIFMNIVLLRSDYKDWRECPICYTKNYPQDNSGKFALDWYVIILLIDDADVSTYLPIARIVTGGCELKIIWILASTAHMRFGKGILNFFVTSVFTNV